MQSTLTSQQSAALPKRPSPWNARTRWFLIFVAVLFWSMLQAGLFSGKQLVNAGGYAQFAAFWRAAFQPDLSADFLAITLQATLVTLAYAVTGLFFSLLIGALFGVLMSELWWTSQWPQQTTLRRGPWVALRGLLAIPRGIHELLWGLFFLNIFGLDPLVAVLAIAIPFGATVAKVFAEMLDEAPHEPYLALLNSGASPLKALLYGLLPLVLADLISYSFYRFECGIRAAAVLGVVGAGGLGYQILLSIQTLNYNETWTLFYALMLLSGLADAWSAQIRRRLGRTEVAGEEFGAGSEQHQRNGNGKLFATQDGAAPLLRTTDPVLRGSVLAVLVLTPLSFWYLNPTWSLLWSERTGRLLADISSRSWPPNISWPYAAELFQLSQATLAMSILAAVLAAVGGTLLSFPATRSFFQPGGIMDAGGNGRWRRIWSTTVLSVTRAVLLLMRAIPAPIWALLFLFIFFPGMLPGVLALAVYNLGVLGRLMAEVVENQDERPSRAIRALGAGSGEVFLYGVSPAVAPRYTAYSLYRWEIAMRETVVVGLVGAGGLGRELTQQLSAFNYRAVLALLICLILLTFAVDMVSASMRKSLR